MRNLFKQPTIKDYIKKPVAIHTENTFSDICHKYIPSAIKQTLTVSELFKDQKNSFITSKEIFVFTKTYIKYREDQIGFEEIKLPNKLWSDKVGDCEDFTIFCSAILCNLRINHTIRMADYGEGWQHIYVKVDKTVLDPVQNRFNYEDKGKYLDYEFRFNSLGKLPVNLYSSREIFILNLWKKFQIDGVIFDKNTEKNSIPTSNVESLVDYLKANLGVKASYLPPEEKVVSTDKSTKIIHLTERIKVELDNATITFDPETLSLLAIKIAGNEVIKPLRKINRADGLHPENLELMNLFKDFTTKSDGISNAIYSGVNFSEHGIASTNLYSVLYLKTNTEIRGTFFINGEQIEANHPFPDFIKLIQRNSDHNVTITTTLKEFDTFFQAAYRLSNYGDKKSKLVILRSGINPYEFEINSEKVTIVKSETKVEDFSAKLYSKTSFGPFFTILEGNYISKLLKLLNKLDVKSITISISNKKDEVRPILISCDTRYGQLTYLLQPISKLEESKMSILNRESSFRSLLIFYKQELQQI